MITKETATDIALAYRELETAEQLAEQWLADLYAKAGKKPNWAFHK